MNTSTDTMRQDILAAALTLAPFEGWTDMMLRKAERKAGLTRGAAALYFPEGPLGVIAYWAEQLDAEAAAKLAAMDLSSMKIREKVTAGVLARMEAMDDHLEAARRASSRLALPDGFAQGTRQVWASADMIWRAIGDTSTDSNYYSKRTILSLVIGSTLPMWLSDETSNKTKARAFLDDRIANVMQFEKLKWEFKSKTENWPEPVALLGALRYGGGFKRRRRRRSHTL
ncbi:COQ9 family protein [Litorimonas sp. RW-G-Af-16]|uniref:COQ9 family protein n=1 Tax=Litorimonas sp. RW-G-Af-16 TaxID=3241168 RepID=UPI003AB0A0CB